VVERDLSITQSALSQQLRLMCDKGFALVRADDGARRTFARLAHHLCKVGAGSTALG
jgi:hypothetical protein